MPNSSQQLILNKLDPESIGILANYLKTGTLKQVKSIYEKLNKKTQEHLISFRDNFDENLLTVAIKSDIEDYEKVRYLLEVVPEIAVIPNSSGSTALHQAARVGKDEIIKLLLRKGEHIKNMLLQSNKAGELPFDSAIDKLNFATARFLFDYLDDNAINKIQLLKRRYNNNNTILHKLAKGQTATLMLEYLFSDQLISWTKSILEERNGGGKTALYEAICADNKDTVQLLILQGANVETIIDGLRDSENSDDFSVHRHFNGATILHCASGELLKWLLDNCSSQLKIDNAENYYRITPLQTAIRADKITAVKTLIEKGAVVTYTMDIDGFTALHMAAFHRKEDAVNILVKTEPKLLVQTDHYGMTPLHWVAAKGIMQMIKKILKLAHIYNLLDDMIKIKARAEELKVDGTLKIVKDKQAFDLIDREGHKKQFEDCIIKLRSKGENEAKFVKN